MTTDLQTAIFKTLCYFDVCDYAPTLLDLQKWLIDYPESVTVSQLQEALAADPRIRQQNGVYHFVENATVAASRQTHYTYSYEKYRHARPFIRLLAAMPGVRAIAVSNSVAWSNASQHADTDIFIITSSQRLWTARLCTTALLKLLRQRPGQQSHAKAVCLPFFISQGRLSISDLAANGDDIYFSFWVNQLYPVFDAGVWEQFVAANSWVAQRLPHAMPTRSIPRRQIHLTRIERWIKAAAEVMPFETLSKHFQLAILPRQLRNQIGAADNSVVVDQYTLKFHSTDRRQGIHDQWQQRVSRV